MIVFLAGPIKHWWDVWDSPEHKHYLAWRDALNKALVDAGHLVYRPHEAFKGQWDEAAQAVNDLAMRTSDVILNMTPPGVPSYGTDDEVDYCRRYNKTVVDAEPPLHGDSYSYWADRVVDDLERAMEDPVRARDVHHLLRRALWALDSGASPSAGEVRDVVSELRAELGVATRLRA